MKKWIRLFIALVLVSVIGQEILQDEKREAEEKAPASSAHP